MMEEMLPIVFRLIVRSHTGVFSDSANATARCIIKHTRVAKLLPRLVEGAADRAMHLRTRCTEYILLALELFETPMLDKYAHLVETQIASLLKDRSEETRAVARKAYWAFHRHYDARAERILRAQDAGTQLHVSFYTFSVLIHFRFTLLYIYISRRGAYTFLFHPRRLQAPNACSWKRDRNSRPPRLCCHRPTPPQYCWPRHMVGSGFPLPLSLPLPRPTPQWPLPWRGPTVATICCVPAVARIYQWPPSAATRPAALVCVPRLLPVLIPYSSTML